jgi:hypothetical protein
LDGVQGGREDATALVFLRFFRVEGVDAAPALFFFPLFDVTPTLLFFFFVAPFFGFFASIISLTFCGLTALFFGSLEDGAWVGIKANGPGATTSFEAQTDFDVMQV